MKRVIDNIGSTWFILASIFVLSSFYILNTIGKEILPGGILKGLFDNPLFVISYFILLVSLFFRGLKIFRDRGTKKIGTVLLMAGLVISGLSIYASLKTRSVADIKAREGEMTPFGTIYKIRSDMPDRIVITGKENPPLPKNAEVMMIINERIRKVDIYPFSVMNGKVILISDINISPTIVVNHDRGKTVADYLRLYPPGNDLRIRNQSPYTIFVSLHPERTYKKGRITIKGYNIADPNFKIILKEGNRTVFEEVMKDNMSVSKGKFQVFVKNSGKWVRVIVVKDRFLISLYGGVLLIVTGAVVKLISIILRIPRLT